MRLRTPILRIHTVAAGGGSIVQLRRRAPARRAGVRGRESRSRLVPARRTADRHRLQCLVRAHPAGFLSRGVRRRRRPAAGRRRGARQIRGAGRVRCPGRATTRPRWPRAASASRSKTWPMPSRRFPCSAATTSPATRSPASAARPASTPAWSPTRSACAACSSIRWRACCPPTASDSRMRWPCASKPSRPRWTTRRWHALAAPFAALEHEARAELAGQGFASERIAIERGAAAQVRRHGFHADAAAAAGRHGGHRSRAEFLAQYRVRYGFHVPGRAMVIDAISLAARGRSAEPASGGARLRARAGALHRAATRRVFFDGALGRHAVLRRATRCGPDDVIDGPAVICERHNTIVVERGWRAMLTAGRPPGAGATRRAARANRPSTHADPVLLEIFNNLFMAIAEQMGVTLANTASSVNIKERLDFSCALFDGAGPAHRQRAAHAGAPGLHGRVGAGNPAAARREHAARRCLRAECALRRRHAPARRHGGDAGVPRRGAVAASSTWPRAATTPTSAASRRARCPRTRRSIDEEGVLLDNVRWSSTACSCEDAAARSCSAAAPYPARNVTQNLADLRAQVAACQKGIAELQAMTRALRPATWCAPTCSTCRTTPRRRCAR